MANLEILDRQRGEQLVLFINDGHTTEVKLRKHSKRCQRGVILSEGNDRRAVVRALLEQMQLLHGGMADSSLPLGTVLPQELQHARLADEITQLSIFTNDRNAM